MPSVIEEVSSMADATTVSYHSDSAAERTSKKSRTARSIVDSLHLSTLIASYNSHFANYSIGRSKTTQLIPGRVWKQDYKNTFPNSPFAEETLKFRVRDELSQLKTGTANQGNGCAELQAEGVLDQLKMTNNHAKQNIIQQRQLILSEILKLSSGFPEQSASTAAAPSQATRSRLVECTEIAKAGGGVKSKAKLLDEQSTAIMNIAADFKATVESRKPHLEAKMLRIKLANLKELKELVIIDEEEFKIEARKLI
jgi:hypothetical protein